MAKKEGSGGDELDMLKAQLLQKDFDVITIADKMKQVEKRSVSILGSMEKLRDGATEKIMSLTEIISFLTREEDLKDARILDLETLLAKAEKDLEDTLKEMNKKVGDMTSRNDFELKNMKLKLEGAQKKIHEMADFVLEKKAIENENARLKEQLFKEQNDHIEAISDVERVFIQENERLKNEIIIQVKETKREMKAYLKERLHFKTKKTILENEQLKKEIGYHIQQTEVLRLQNEKLTQEIGEAIRSLGLAKELEEDMAHRNHMYQQTTKILVYKLQEKEKATQGSKKGSVQENNFFKVNEDGKTNCQSEVIKFLYACLEDIETERIAKLPVENAIISVDSIPKNNVDLNTSNFTLNQRHALLTQLLHHALSLRSMTDNMTKYIPKYATRGQRHGLGITISNIQVDDILAMPVEKILKEEKLE